MSAPAPSHSSPGNSTSGNSTSNSSPPPSSPPPTSSSPPPTSSSPPPTSSSPPPTSSNSSPPPPPPSSPPPHSSPPPPAPSNSSHASPPNASTPPPLLPPPTSSNSSHNFNSPPPPPPGKSIGADGPSRQRAKFDSGGGGGGGGDNSSSNAIVGAVLGVGILVLIVVIACVITSRKKKRKQMYYYGEPSRHAAKVNNNYYNNNGQNQNYYGGPPHQDHVVRVQNGMGMNGGDWGAPPPPPMMMNSADMSSNYSTGGPPPLPLPSPTLALGLKNGTFTYEELAAATNNFSDDNLLGQGGFGYVHKGVFPNGKEVAVKSLKSGSCQGEREFQAEIEIISRVHHRHLVSLVGYSIAGGQRMLVYEFIPNQTLEYHLHGKGVPTMDWPTRLRIAIGSAKGLAYLHEDCHPRIIHRDIKAANVLIDNSFEAKVADFGLAKLTTDNNTHVSTRVMGTFGYLAPEYASSGKLTEKSDVFSFGVMLLELITGKRPVDPTNSMDDSLVDWARPLLARGIEEDGNFGELVDPILEGNYNHDEMIRMAACAAASIRHSGKKRPRMSQIVRALEGNVSMDDLRDGVKPAVYGSSYNASSAGSSDYDTMQYNADLQKFRKQVFSSQEYTSSASSGENSK